MFYFISEFTDVTSISVFTLQHKKLLILKILNLMMEGAFLFKKFGGKKSCHAS